MELLQGFEIEMMREEEKDDPPELRSLPFGLTTLPGNLSRRAIVDRYEEATGRACGDFVFYYAFGLFKIAVIAQQIYRRFKLGHTRDRRFAAFLGAVRLLAHTAEAAIAAGRIGAR